jgi:HEPN domain-containing protein
MQPLEHAELLMRKARQDEFTMQKLIPDPASPDDVIGFHAQQAVEKMLKAVLAIHSVCYRRTHDLVDLLDILRGNAISYPEDIEEIRRLTPFAVAFRYDDVPDEPEQAFDRAWVLQCVRKVRAWSEAVLREHSPG